MIYAQVKAGEPKMPLAMMKKGENPESKKYAALREGLTEAIAVPSYIICGEIGSKLGNRHHSTILHGVEIIEKKLEDKNENEELIKTLDVLNKKINPQ